MKGKNIRKASPISMKPRMLIAAIAVLIIATVGAKGVFAWLNDSTNSIKNTFTPSKVTCMVDEKFENNMKENVSIKNTGDTDAYIRVSLVFTWKDAVTNNILAGTPVEDMDYIMEIINTDKWIKGTDGFYYCQASIAPGTNTPVLINSCTVKSPREDRYLQLEIVASAIQAQPFNSAAEAWNATKEPLKGGQSNE